jgi:hypothetical protein
MRMQLMWRVCSSSMRRWGRDERKTHGETVARYGGGGCAVGLRLRNSTRDEGERGKLAPHGRPTLRVGMWTLRRDQDVTLEPAGLDSKVSLRTCEGCAVRRVAQPVEIRAEGNAAALSGEERAGRVTQVWIEGQ